MDRAELSRAVRERARELGFAKVGIATAGALATEAVHLHEWIERGFHGQMAWMATGAAKRADPRLHMPNVRSVISVAMNYFTPHEHSDTDGTGKISRYAWGDDYHDVVGDRVRELNNWLHEHVPDLEAKIAVDTSPVMDKAWAVRAGIGWIGKHTNVITPEIGSWVFLGALLVSIDLEPDAPFAEDLCGTCTACIDACPTAAIVEPYVVDSNRCISYVTIELRGDDLPVTTHGWVYGCDVCQDVCPWNRFREPTPEGRFEPRPGLVEPGLAMLAEMTQEEFSERFRRSAIKRTKVGGIRRNARALMDR